MNRYGNFGRPVLLLEAYKEWRDERMAAAELEEADTKADFPAWLWGPVRFSVWQGYTRIEPVYRQYARIEDMPDFRPRLIRGLNALKGFGYVGDGGEYPGMSRSERGGPALVIDTYGAVYAITRQAIINDDSGELLNRNPSEMGYAAGMFVSEALVALIESNPTAFDGQAFFSAQYHSNAGTAAISEDAVANSISAMETQLDDNGFKIRVRVAKALVQSALQELQFRRILNSTVTGVAVNYTGGTAGIGTGYFDKGTYNPLQGILSGDAIVREAFLTDTTDWYLFADPGDVPAFGIGFLNGQETPFVGIKDPMVRNALGPGMDPYDFEFDEVAFKVRHDFGVAAIDWRGAYKNVVTGS